MGICCRDVRCGMYPPGGIGGIPNGMPPGDIPGGMPPGNIPGGMPPGDLPDGIPGGGLCGLPRLESCDAFGGPAATGRTIERMVRAVVSDRKGVACPIAASGLGIPPRRGSSGLESGH